MEHTVTRALGGATVLLQLPVMESVVIVQEPASQAGRDDLVN